MAPQILDHPHLITEPHEDDPTGPTPGSAEGELDPDEQSRTSGPYATPGTAESGPLDAEEKSNGVAQA